MRRVAVVTGAAGGLGRAIVASFRDDGWRVVGIDQVEEAAAPPHADVFIRANLADPEEVESAFADVTQFDRIDALVNNAAVQSGSTILETSPSEWDAVMASNVRSAYLTIRAAFGLMRQRDAAVVNVSSVHAVATSPGVAAYATSKAALVGLTRAAAVELAPSGIRVNAVLPGAIDTPMLKAGARRRGAKSINVAVSELEARTPLRRVARPEEIAQAILFLSDSVRSSFMTGQLLIIDGGASAHLSTE
ncbi:MAG TPA: SDR family NAD(P)-dependent oxidoreductase [Candidatus Limnocylindria bacterium]|nr:SDR family NAD(P)-dependent oxidoreductase [Candidatus Limnocylindria bacterium]